VGVGLKLYWFVIHKSSKIKTFIQLSQLKYDYPLVVNHLSSDQWDSILKNLRKIKIFKRFTFLLNKWKFSIVIDLSFCVFTYKVKIAIALMSSKFRR